MKKLLILLTITALAACNTANHATTEPTEPPPPTPTNTPTEQVHEDLPSTTESDEVSEIFDFSENENGEESEETAEIIGFSNLPNFPNITLDGITDYQFTFHFFAEELGEEYDRQYAWGFNDNDETLLYVIIGENAELLAVFPPLGEFELEGYAHFPEDNRNHIRNLQLLDGWIILILGGFHRDPNNFYVSGETFIGSLVRLREDGSQLTHFAPIHEPHFRIADGWLYYNHVDLSPGVLPSVRRMRADGSDLQDFGEFMTNIVAIHGDVFGRFDRFVDGERFSDFVKFNPENGEIITLFAGENLPRIEGGRVWYIMESEPFSENYIHFGAQILDIWDSDRFNPFFIVYTAQFRVDRNGENWELLAEQFHVDGLE